MIRDDEIESLKQSLGSDGKLIITDDMSDSQKERYQFINSLNLNLLEVLTRKNDDVESDVSLDPDSEEFNDVDDFADEVETLDDSMNSSVIEENGASVDDLNDLF